MSAIPCLKMGLAGRKNGELLSLAEEEGFEVFLTIDRGIEYEQNLGQRNIAIILIRSKTSRLGDLLPSTPEILAALGSILPGQLVRIS